MEQYYDSDDDVCWGPYTKREFLRDVLQPRNIASRHSVGCDPRFTNDVDRRGESLIEPEIEPHLHSGCVTESKKFIEKISEILNNTQEDLNCSDSSEYNEKLETQESNEVPDEYNMQLSNQKILEDSDVCFFALSYMSDATKSTRHEDTSFITCPFTSDINDSTLNVKSGFDNLCLNSLPASDAEVSASTSVTSSYKKDEDYKAIEVQVNTDSEESDASFKFDDTLEDINRLLSEEAGGKFSSDTEQEMKSINKLNPPTVSLIPIPTKSKTTPSQSPCGNKFKIPEKPVRTKLISPMHSKDRFKAIKSPVAHYIKNAPVTPLYVKVTPRKCKKELIISEYSASSSEKQNKENVSEFPEVIYKKAKRTVTNVQNTFKLPSNIESLSSQNLITKHVAKFGDKKTSIGRRLLEEDLTVSTISDESTLNSSAQNVSIYETKHAFI